MLFSQIKPGQRVAILPGWGYRIGQNLYRNGTNHLPGVVESCYSPTTISIMLDSGQRVHADSRALKSMES